MDKKKVIYIGLILILTVIVSITYFSYAFFTSRYEQRGKLNIVTGTLNYKIESNDLINDAITLAPGEIKNIEIKLTSLNDINSKYELFYETNNNQAKVGYSGADTSTGIIDAKDIKTVIIHLKNYSTTNNATITFYVEGGFANNNLVRSKGLAIPSSTNLCSYTSNQTFNFSYTGNTQIFDTDFCIGNYKIEAWGANGANTTGANSSAIGGKGAYTSGLIKIDDIKQFYIYVGQAGSATPTGATSSISVSYNGGGNTSGQACCGRSYGSGGGATDIRLVGGSWDNFDSLKSRIMVAGGGGGSYAGNNDVIASNNGGNAGGLTGYSGVQSGNSIDSWYCFGQGALQTEGGRITSNCRSGASSFYNMLTGSFGSGGGAAGANTGGGGGYYGGSRSYHIASAGGGSSFISGHNGCDALAESSTSGNINHTGQSVHFSGYRFTDTVMIDGSGYSWTNVKGSLEQMPNPNGGFYASGKGHTGNGHARITYLGE